MPKLTCRKCWNLIENCSCPPKIKKTFTVKENVDAANRGANHARVEKVTPIGRKIRKSKKDK